MGFEFKKKKKGAFRVTNIESVGVYKNDMRKQQKQIRLSIWGTDQKYWVWGLKGTLKSQPQIRK